MGSGIGLRLEAESIALKYFRVLGLGMLRVLGKVQVMRRLGDLYDFYAALDSAVVGFVNLGALGFAKKSTEPKHSSFVLIRH